VSWGWPGLPRRRPDQVRDLATNATAPGSSSVVRARYVIVTGDGDGVFAYNGTPALGNPPIAWLTGGGLVDPYGNVLPSTLGTANPGNFTVTDSGGQTSIAGTTIAIVPTGGGGSAIFGAPSPGVAYMVSGSELTDTAEAFLWLFSAAASGSFGAPLAMFEAGVAAAEPEGSGSPPPVETWHTVTNPTGITGTIRAKILAQENMAVLDVNCMITSTLAAPNAYTAGSLRNSSYYPAAARQYDVSVNQQWSTTANASPRIQIPTSGGIVFDMPGFNAAGNSCIVSMTQEYPLN
jgi:hypothetical protein